MHVDSLVVSERLVTRDLSLTARVREPTKHKKSCSAVKPFWRQMRDFQQDVRMAPSSIKLSSSFVFNDSFAKRLFGLFAILPQSDRPIAVNDLLEQRLGILSSVLLEKQSASWLRPSSVCPVPLVGFAQQDLGL